MTDTDQTDTDHIDTDHTATQRAAWIAKMEELTEESGYFHTLGARHYSFFADEGTTLLVSFDTVDAILAREDQLPQAHAHAMARGWSHVCVIANGPTWFRDPAVYAYFDRLVDETFLEEFDTVLFYGAGMGGYAACAFAVSAPGAQVLAINPRATLEPAQAAWDKRDLAARRLDFTSRYGYAPDMLQGVDRATVIHDTTLPEEAAHAALFRAPYITRLSARRLGPNAETGFVHMGSLPELLDAAMAGTLTPQLFAEFWRKRRDYAPYLRALLNKAEASGRPGHEAMICRSVTRRLRAPRFAKRLSRLTSETAALAQTAPVETTGPSAQ